jgi:hypothetical protein
MQFTFSKGQFDVPEGKFLATFVGVKLLDDTGAKDKDGKPMPPAMAWEFQIADGEHAGKKCDRVTGRQPTPKSGCGKMLAAVTDQILKDGGQYDVAQFVGKTYRVTVEEKPSGNPAPVRVYDQPPAPAGGPPPRKPANATPAERKFWVPMGDATPLLTAAEIEDHIKLSKLSLDAEICPEGGEEYKAVSEYLPEMKSLIPF